MYVYFMENFCAIDLWKNISFSLFLILSKNNFLGDWKTYLIINSSIFLVNKLLLLLLSYWKVWCFRDLCKIRTVFSFHFISFWSQNNCEWIFSFDSHTVSTLNEIYECTTIAEKVPCKFPIKFIFTWKKASIFISQKLIRKNDLFQMEQNVPTFYCIESLHLSHYSFIIFEILLFYFIFIAAVCALFSELSSISFIAFNSNILRMCMGWLILLLLPFLCGISNDSVSRTPNPLKYIL